jgi:hypothetical protein
MNFVFSPWLTFTITLRFMYRFNTLATDIDSLTPGLDEHVVRLRFGRRVFQKKKAIFLGALHSIVDSVANALLSITIT